MARGEGALPAAVLLASVVTVAACWLQACAGPQGPAPEAPASRVDPDAAKVRFDAIVAAQNARAARLESLESRASLELRYSDADGDHFDQCEADIFLASGGRGALRATKVGNNLLWVGSDGRRGWIFRLEKQPTSLTVFEDIGAFAPGQQLAGDGSAEFSLLSPGAVRAIAGLGAIPEGYALRAVVGASGPEVESRFEVVTPLSDAADAVLRFSKSGLPERVRIERRGGGPLVSAELSEYVAAQVENLAQGAWPQVPRRIVASGVAAAGKKGAEARLYLDAPIAMAKRMKPRFFVLDDLVAQLRPDVVEHVVAGDGADARQ